MENQGLDKFDESLLELLQRDAKQSMADVAAAVGLSEPASYRRITRWEHENVLETMQILLDARPQAAVARRQTVEHVFGTLKSWLGTTPLLMKTLP